MNTDAKIRNTAKKKANKLFARKSLAERWLPVNEELNWVISGRLNEGEHKKILPAYCYSIFELYRRNLFAVFSPVGETIKPKLGQSLAQCKTVEELLEQADIDWGKLGSLVSMGQRASQFFEQQAEKQVEELGLEKLPKKELDSLFEKVLGGEFVEQQVAKLEETHPGKSLEDIVSEISTKTGTTFMSASALWEKWAYQAGPKALVQFKAGCVNGATKFMDAEGKILGEKKLKLPASYECRLTFWVEIEEMINAQPPKRMEDLWDWLAPFSYAGWIEIQDLDQLVALCRSIGLKLKKPGAPRKAREC